VNQILLIEDDPDQSALYERVLSLTGYQVTAVPNGESALGQLADHHFDLVLSDWYLPGMSGDVLIAEVKKQHQLVRTILMSSHHEVSAAARKSGADGCLQKGDLRQLLALVAALLTG